VETETVTALVTIEHMTAVQLFAPGALNPILERIKAEVRAIETDISTEAGRKAIGSLAYKVSRTKTFIDEQRKSLVADEKKRLSAIDAEGRRVWDELDALKDEVMAPLTEWRNAENERIAEHERRIAAMFAFHDRPLPTVEHVNKALLRIDELWNHNFQEFTKRATTVRERVVLFLQGTLKDLLRAEADRIERERIRVEAEEKARVERETKIAEDARLKAEAEAKRREDAQALAAKQREDELARVAAEEKGRLERERKESEARLQKSLDDARAKAQRDKLAAEERERIAEANRIALAEKAEADRKESEEVLRKIVEGTKERERKAEEERVSTLRRELADRAAAEKRAEAGKEAAVIAERKRQEDIRAAEEAQRTALARERMRREADQAHRQEVHDRAVHALIARTELIAADALEAIEAIAAGHVPGVSITY
jgi:colicin import membrane protein